MTKSVVWGIGRAVTRIPVALSDQIEDFESVEECVHLAFYGTKVKIQMKFLLCALMWGFPPIF